MFNSSNPVGKLDDQVLIFTFFLYYGGTNDKEIRAVQ